MTVYRYRDLAIELEYIKVDKDGTPKLPEISREENFEKFTEKNPILHDPLISDWWQDLCTRKSGKPVGCAKVRLLKIQKLCNSLRIKPAQLLIEHQQTEKICRNFLQMFQEGKIESYRKTKGKIEFVQYLLAQAVTDFCGFHHMTWKKGVGGVMSRKVVGHGQYADVKLTKEEIEKAISYIKKKYGLDSDVFRWFTIALESCARMTALFNMTNDYTKHDSKKTGNVTYFMKVIKKKTIHIKCGKWKTWIRRKDTEE